MTGVGVLGTDVTQSYNKIFHLRGLLLLLLLSGTSCTSYANGANGSCSGSNKLKVLELEVTNEDSLTYVQGSYVNNDLIGQVSLESLNCELTCRLSQLTTNLNTGSVTCEAYGYSDCNGLTLLDTVEINVEDLLTYGVELNLAHYSLLNLTVDVELNDVRVGSVDQRLNSLSVNGECNLLTTTIQNARDLTLTTACLSSLLTEISACSSLNLKCFHSFL